MKNKLFKLEYYKSEYGNHIWHYKSNNIINCIGYWLDLKYRYVNNNYFGINLKIKMKHEK